MSAAPVETEDLLRSSALQTSNSILLLRRRAEDELLLAKQALEARTEELAATVAMMRATFESTTDGILVTDSKGNITDFNQRYLDMWRISRAIAERALGDELRKILSEQLKDPAAYLDRVGEIYTTAPDETNDLLVLADGRIFERHSKSQCIEDRVIGRVWSFRDVTDQAQSGIVARRLAAIVDSSYDAIISKDLDLNVTSWNAGAERIFGYTAAEMIGTSIMRIVPPDRYAEEEMIRERITRGERVEPMETVRVAKDGRLLDISVTISPLRDSDGKVIGASKVARDITERKRSERALAESHSLLRAVIESTEDAVFVKDLEGRYQMINPAGARFLQVSPEEIVGARDDEVVPGENAFTTIAHDREVLAAKTSLTYEDTSSIGGQQRTFLSTKSPYRDANGNIIGLVGISRDITERKRNEQALEAAKNEAEAANRAKSEFLSRMSHELRTPLNAIIGFSQLLELGELPPSHRERVGYIHRAGRHLLELINEVLDIARIEAGRLELSLEPVSVTDVLHEAADLVRPLASERSVHVTFEPNADLSIHVCADRQRLKQVLLNLLANAVKYNRERGTVTLSCELMPNQRVRIGVTDSGIGISKENLSRLFVPFERLGAEHSSVQGTGLGLAVSKRFIEVMDGTLGCESELGTGSKFWVELPRTVNAQDRATNGGDIPKIELQTEANTTVLYIEDNVSNLTLIEHLVQTQSKLKLISAMEGKLGIELARRHQPDLILLDVHLPDIDGVEVLRRLRADASTSDIPVVVLSADATSRQIQRLRDAGAHDYLTKPLDLQRFFAVIEEQTRNRAKLTATL